VWVSVAFFEIAGRSCTDLLGEAGVQIMLREDSKGRINVVGVAEEPVGSAEELLATLTRGKKRRATHATDVNAGSSRSHAVMRLTVHLAAPMQQVSGRSRSLGKLMMVDCAGTERKEDSMYHTAERRKECSEINSSLHALKECFRAMGSSNGDAHVPFRASNLTKVLMETFTTRDASIAMIATLSPTSTDTEHSISTLRTVCTLRGSEQHITDRKEDVKERKEELTANPPAKWTGEEVRAWLRTTEGGKFKAYVDALPSSVDGKQLLRWNLSKFTFLCENRESLGLKLYKALRAEMDRVNELMKQRRAQNRK